MTDLLDDPTLTALSPLDGRYSKSMIPLRAFFSEAALFRYRVRVEVEYLIFLARTPSVTFVEPLTFQQQAQLRSLYLEFGPRQAHEIVAWDKRINHDAKAVEYWLREQLPKFGLEHWNEALHFGITSEDVNNLAYALLLREARDEVLIPPLNAIKTRLYTLADTEAQTPMKGRTHGQAATPTTMGKEFAVFGGRLERAMSDVTQLELTGKLNGATGTFAAHTIAMPHVDWITFSRAFIRSLGLHPILRTTQIEPHDGLAALCDAMKRLNNVLLDVCQDCWRYISDGYLVQPLREGEVGSSTMPHKINPIDFENSEGNLGVANALLEFFSRKLPVSRLQRDLSDSTVLRNFGVAFGHSLLSYQRLERGLQRVAVNRERLLNEVVAHPEVLAEAIQTILRRIGYPEPYEVLKNVTQGRAMTLAELHAFTETLDVPPEVHAELQALRPETYLGLAARLARLHET